MRTVIQGKEVSVTLKTAGRDLTTQEIVMAHQLATGNFEALFVDDDSDDQDKTDQEPDQDPDEDDERVDYNATSKPAWIEKGETVSVEVTCPFCGYYGKGRTRWGNSFSKCPKCNEKLHNAFATELVGEKNSWGCVYTATEPMIFRSEGDPYQEMFGDD
ncbi:hypothetical protein A5886_001826 [Enterococcus sp. 8G7_MSG3316]|uniref:Uncharacterized protein n=1 Tax=Candidatus Enterococcus testudinis TaxID=1834191 RepID=A0A242A6S7_9ENTE|nr:hypothetical protein [Enterococcus sp. 8G7_MSG3316]OTN76747.1 hypothetical protein A5886_001826 [Enterococcus sp. 8G7_MSG3316]